jgi:hypothetical protein
MESKQETGCTRTRLKQIIIATYCRVCENDLLPPPPHTHTHTYPHFVAQIEARSSAYRLIGTDMWSGRSSDVGHAQTNGVGVQMSQDSMIPVTAFGTPLTRDSVTRTLVIDTAYDPSI